MSTDRPSFDRDGRVDVPAVTPHRIADPTGVGDAYRGGFMKGLAAGADDVVCARLGSVAATFALEHLGGRATRIPGRSSRRDTNSTSGVSSLRSGTRHWAPGTSECLMPDAECLR